jgi:hypothetical protein
MSYDSLVDEVRAIREAYAERFQFDPDAIYRDLKEQEKASGRKFVTLQPKRFIPKESETPLVPVSR